MENHNELSIHARIDKLSDRARILFSVAICTFVIVISFFYGFAKGLGKNVTPAQASATLGVSFDEAARLPEGITLPLGTTVLPIGKNVRINDRDVEIVSFVSERSVREISRDQLARWSRKNLQFVHRITERRAVLLGTDRVSGQKYSFMVWMVPPTLRRFVSQGHPVQGTLAVSARDAHGAHSEMPFEGEVPGVPVMPGGSGGAVFSSDDIGGRSHTGVYTNPGTVEDSVTFYRTLLSEAGWQEVSSRNDLPFEGAHAQQRFTRGAQEITLLYAVPNITLPSSDDAKTVVTVIRSGRMPRV